MTSQFPDMTSSSKFLEALVKFSYWSKFHVNIIIGSRIMTILFYKELTRNPKIRNTPVWVLSNIWRRGGVMGTKFGTNVSNRILLNAATCQGLQPLPFLSYSGKTNWGVGGAITPHPPRPTLPD